MFFEKHKYLFLLFFTRKIGNFSTLMIGNTFVQNFFCLFFLYRWKFLQKMTKMRTKKTKQNDKKLRKRIFLWRFCVLLNISEFVKNLKIKFLKNSTIDEELIKAKFYGSSLVVFSKVCFHFCFPTCPFLEQPPRFWTCESAENSFSLLRYA